MFAHLDKAAELHSFLLLLVFDEKLVFKLQ